MSRSHRLWVSGVAAVLLAAVGVLVLRPRSNGPTSSPTATAAAVDSARPVPTLPPRVRATPATESDAAPPEEETPVDRAPVAPSFVKIELIDAESRAPVRAGEVWVEKREGSSASSTRFAPGEDGVVLVPVGALAAATAVIAKAPGFVTTRAGPRPDATEVEILLIPAPTLLLRVVDEGGHPVAEAAVVVGDRSARADRLGIARVALETLPAPEFATVLWGGCRLVRKLAIDPEGAGRRGTITIPTTVCVRVRVVSVAGTPVGGAQVLLEAMDSTERFSASGVTDDVGVADVDVRPSGAFWMLVTADGHVSVSRADVLVSSDRGLEGVLRSLESSWAAGTVTDAAGRPVAGVKISAGGVSATSDASGEFALHGVQAPQPRPGGRDVTKRERPLYARLEGKGVVAPPQRLKLDGHTRLIVGRPGQIRGRVVDSRGSPRRDFVIHAIYAGAGWITEFGREGVGGGGLTWDADGGFRWSGLMEGEAVVWVTDNSQAECTRRVVVRASGSTEVGDITLSQGHALQVHLRDTQGRDLQVRGWLGLRDLASGSWLPGQFGFNGLPGGGRTREIIPPGRYEVFVAAPGYLVSEPTEVMVSGRETLEAVIAEPSDLVAYARAPDGLAPAVDVELRYRGPWDRMFETRLWKHFDGESPGPVSYSGPEWELRARTDDSGSCHFRRLPPGTYDVHARSAEFEGAAVAEVGEAGVVVVMIDLEGR